MFKKITPRTWIIAVVVLAAAAVAILSYQAAASGVVTVSGNTASAENQPGWMFNRAVPNPTPYEFNLTTHTLGLGALYVGPAANAADVFIAELFPGQPLVSDFTSFSYDFMIGAGGDESDLNQISVSVYANIDASTNNYDCRFDYSPVSGGNNSFTKHVVYPGIAPMSVIKGSDRLGECPQTLDAMPEGSHIRVIALTLGNTGTDDTGLDAYFDNVELVVGSDATTYNFEAAPRTQADCADKKWQQYNFRNQGQCIKAVGK